LQELEAKREEEKKASAEKATKMKEGLLKKMNTMNAEQ